MKNSLYSTNLNVFFIVCWETNSRCMCALKHNYPLIVHRPCSQLRTIRICIEHSWGNRELLKARSATVIYVYCILLRLSIFKRNEVKEGSVFSLLHNSTIQSSVHHKIGLNVLLNDSTNLGSHTHMHNISFGWHTSPQQYSGMEC